MMDPNILVLAKAMAKGNSSGGASIDVTASVGQTIVVEEVDANGKPTKWKAAEYQPRTHWTGAKVLVPEHTFDAGISGPNMVMHGDIKLLGLTVGKTYTVVFDGVTYTCVAEVGEITQDGVNMIGIISIGNLGMFGGTDNGLPFILGDLPFYNNGCWACLPYVYGEHTLSIIGNAEVCPIPVQYMPKMCVEINVSSDDFDSSGSGSRTGDKTLDTTEIMNALANGRQIYINFAGAMSVRRFSVVDVEVYSSLGKFDSLADLIKAHEMTNMLSNTSMALYFTDPYHDDAYILFINSGDE